MKLNLAYGRNGLAVEFPAECTTVIEPAHRPGLPDEKSAVLAALREPIGAVGLRASVKPTDRVCVVFTDLTRATPNDRIIPWILEELAHAPAENITLLNSTGTHRANTRAELERMLGPEVVRRFRVVNHDCQDAAALVETGRLRDGTPVRINRHLVEADARIITGFIEPHFFAGFSGGPKGIVPGCAGLGTVMANHRPANLRHPGATFGVTAGNPLWEELRDAALSLGRSFLLNVALNEHREITGVFAGDLIEAHRVGCAFVRDAAMQPVEALFDVVVTTNSGYPLDLNLYQTVKGMSAAARIVKPGGAIVVASECSEGVPAGSPYERLLRAAASPADLLARLEGSPTVQPEQWQAQIQAQIQTGAAVLLFSALPEATVRACHLAPCRDITAWLHQHLATLGPRTRVAVLPQGPLTIPYLDAESR